MKNIGVASYSGGDEPKSRQLTPKEMQEWNSFLDFVKLKGYEGSSELNKKDKRLGESLFSEFKKFNPNVSINYDIVPSVQSEMQRLKSTAQDFAARHNDPNAKNIMSDISPVDGWFGSKTSQFRFPEMISQQFNNNNLQSNQNLGLVNSQLQPTGLGMNANRPLSGVKLEKMSDGKLYYQNKDGDYILYQ